jgi:hypothetical protein
MYDMLGQSLESVGVTSGHLEPLADRGDGVLVLIRPHDDVPKSALLGLLIPQLFALLAEYNAQVAEVPQRMRLRVVVHAGEINIDSRGFYGRAIDVAIRLLDSQSVKRALRQAEGPLALVISEEIHSAIVCHGYVDARTYFPQVRVRIGGRQQRGWVHIPAQPDAPFASVATPFVRSALHSGFSSGADAEEQLQSQVASIIGRARTARGAVAAERGYPA